MDKEIVTAVIGNYLEELAAYDATSSRLRTPYPAQDIDGFFNLVGQALKACQEAEGVKKPIIYTEDMPEADDNISGEVISYSLKKRMPGHFEQGGQGMAMTNRQTRTRRKMFREAIDDPEHPGLKLYMFGKEFDNIVEFKIWAKTNKTANRRAMWFENFMEEYTWYFRASGIKLISYEGREADVQISPENVKLVCRPLLFYVRTEQVSVVKEYNLRSLVVGTSL